ncbi:Translocation protein Sec63 [Gracilaria domingensis]|nr:Translocation protein Sec63 [Gracilaria domingensis]
MLYRQTLQQTGRFRDLLGAFCGSVEFQHLYKSDNDDALKELADTLRRAGRTEVKKTKTVVQPTSAHAQNLIVMTAYLARLPIPKELQYIKHAMLERVEPLMTALTDTVGAFQRPDCQAAWNKTFMHGHTLYMANAIVLTQSLLQALDEKSSPFMQIPHFTEKEVRYCLNSRTPSIKTIYDFMKLDMSEQRNLLRGLSDDEFLDVRAFCDRFPSANLEVKAPVVEGEEDGTVHAGDTVTIRAKLTIMRRSGSVFSPHTPNIGVRKEEAWWIWLADERLQCPIDVKRLTPSKAKGYGPKRRHKHCADDDCGEEKAEMVEELLKDPRVTRFNVKFRFQAPRAGQYNLEVKTACDCYNGAAKGTVVKMKVEKEVEPPSVDSVKYFDTDDESEAEEEEGSSDEEGTEDEYEYIEVTDEESEAGDFEEDDDDDDDAHGISVGAAR